MLTTTNCCKCGAKTETETNSIPVANDTNFLSNSQRFSENFAGCNGGVEFIGMCAANTPVAYPINFQGQNTLWNLPQKNS